MQIANVLLEGTVHNSTLNNLNNNSDLSTLPFEGYNLENLWDWMLLMDSGAEMGGSDVIGWVNSEFDTH